MPCAIKTISIEPSLAIARTTSLIALGLIKLQARTSTVDSGLRTNRSAASGLARSTSLTTRIKFAGTVLIQIRAHSIAMPEVAPTITIFFISILYKVLINEMPPAKKEFGKRTKTILSLYQPIYSNELTNLYWVL